MSLSKRKDIRLKNYDYSRNGTYFITVCVKDRHTLLWKNNNVGATLGRPDNQNKSVLLSEIGQIIDSEIKRIGSVYDTVLIDKYVIMPNHIHMIVLLQNKGSGRPEVAPTISRIIQQFKGSISKQIGFSIWQKLFYDRITRNEEEYRKIWYYIDTNPLKWQEDCYYEKGNG